MLTGGGSTRLGQDKATVVVAGRRMIDRVLDQIPADVPVVVVGPDPGVQRSVQVTREDPPGAVRWRRSARASNSPTPTSWG